MVLLRPKLSDVISRSCWSCANAGPPPVSASSRLLVSLGRCQAVIRRLNFKICVFGARSFHREQLAAKRERCIGTSAQVHVNGFEAWWSPLDPRICNIALDSNALDRDGSVKDELVSRFREMTEAGQLTVVIAGGVRDEVQHPRTPADVKRGVLPRISIYVRG
jgi:hypothetical protein